jgi:hypothetical protein
VKKIDLKKETKYSEHGYDFRFITDHDMVTDVESLNALFGGGGQFLIIREGEVIRFQVEIRCT